MNALAKPLRGFVRSMGRVLAALLLVAGATVGLRAWAGPEPVGAREVTPERFGTGKEKERPIVARDRTAVSIASEELSRYLELKPESGLAVYGFSLGVGSPVYYAIEVRRPFEWMVTTRVLTEADRLNGLEWEGVVDVYAPALRIGGKGAYRREQVDFQAVSWGKWMAASRSSTPRMSGQSYAFRIALQFQDGKWVGDGNGGKVIIRVPHGNDIEYTGILVEASAATAATGAPQHAASAPAAAVSGTNPESAPSVSNPAISGVWVGRLSERGVTYDVRVGLQSLEMGHVIGSSTYGAPLNCVGTLTLESGDKGRYVAREQMPEGSPCASTHLVFASAPNGDLRAEWFWPDLKGKVVMSTTLAKSGE